MPVQAWGWSRLGSGGNWQTASEKPFRVGFSCLVVKILPILTSALSKEEDVETVGDQELYDPGARRGSNYKTPMERFKSMHTAYPGLSLKYINKRQRNLKILKLNIARLIEKITISNNLLDVSLLVQQE